MKRRSKKKIGHSVADWVRSLEETQREMRDSLPFLDDTVDSDFIEKVRMAIRFNPSDIWIDDPQD